MGEMKLNDRLAAIAGLIKGGAVVADIGTDHGYLPIWLIANRICKTAIATDLRPGPLGQAKRFAEKYGVETYISFRLGNGLDTVEPEEADTIVIAGMGGETTINILSAVQWIKGGGHRLILQPQSKIPEVMFWLSDNGFCISDAVLTQDAGRMYLVIQAEKGSMPEPMPCSYYVPEILAAKGDVLLDAYVSGLISKLENALEGMSKSNNTDNGERGEFFSAALRGLYELKTEI